MIIHLDLLIAGFTVKIVFVVTLNSLFTDVMVRRVILCQPFLSSALRSLSFIFDT